MADVKSRRALKSDSNWKLEVAELSKNKAVMGMVMGEGTRLVLTWEVRTAPGFPYLSSSDMEF